MADPAAGPSFPLTGKKLFVAGHRGMVGSAIVRRLSDVDCEVVTATRSDLDLRRQADVEAWFDHHRPDGVFMAAATVGGILANDTRPAEFLLDNTLIATNVIDAAHRSGVSKLLFLGSSCIYPRLAPQPIREDQLLTGPLEPTNEWYAVAKIAGIKLCQAYRRQYGSDFISVMPTNLYGPQDNYDPASSHVLPALIRKTVEARDEGRDELVVWGSGRPLREFLHADDLADAVVFLMQRYSEERHINVGSGTEISIAELARRIGRIAHFEGSLVFDATKPDGTPRKLMDSSALFALGWRPSISLDEGLRRTITEFDGGRRRASR